MNFNNWEQLQRLRIKVKIPEITEITLEIFGVENQFRYLWKAETCSYSSQVINVKKELAGQNGG